MGVYEDLLEWSQGRPDWQRDALRRLVLQGPLQDADLAELARLAMVGGGLTEEEITATPLEAAHLPIEGTTHADVRLIAISAPKNVNSLPPDARLEFEPAGLTVVYGDNGAGKSGYVRILKRVCRARGNLERVLPNVLRNDTEPTSATIDFLVGDATRARQWTLVDASADELGAVSVFDRACAAVYLSADNEVAYRPLGLDLLDDLARAARGVRERLERTRDANVQTLLGPPAGLAGSKVLEAVWPPGDGLTQVQLDVVARWSTSSADELERIERALSATTPEDAIATISARRAELGRALRLTTRATQVISAADRQPEVTATADAAEAAVRDARDAALGVAEIGGVGGALWRALWATAERYSTTDAYPGHEFPNVEPEARCVLCGQRISVESRLRFEALRLLVQEELASAARRSQEDVARLRETLRSLAEDPTLDEAQADLRTADPEAADRVGPYLELATTRARSAVGMGTAGGPEPTDRGVEDPSDWLRVRMAAIAADIVALQRATDPADLERMRTDGIDLQARRWVSENGDALIAESARRRVNRIVGSALDTCATNAITVQSGRLTDTYVTDALREDFDRELKGLNPSRVSVRIVQGGAYGATYHRLELEGTTTPARVSEVVSDGEFRAVALANFLAEITHSNTRSAIVLDDPVTSLDHRYRDRVAARLVQEASRRQVIVFTHDLVFLQDLATKGEQAEVPIAFRRLRPTPTHVGWPIAELPWHGMKVGQRLDALQLDLNSLRTSFDAGDMETYERGAERWYGGLRSTWERAVEEILFVDAIGRYRSEVKTQNLTSLRVWVIDEADVEDLNAGMTKSSSWINAHDQPAAVNRSLPPPDELRDDLKFIQDWVSRLKAKRKP